MMELYNKNSIFRCRYLQNLINRFTNASLSVEGEEGNLSDTIQAMKIYYQQQALEYAFDIKKGEKLTIGNIKEIEKTLTNGEYENFRTTQAEVGGSKIPRSKPKNIYMEMYQLFDNYYNIWSELEDPFLREALFHIKFLHIHPFEDGNGRTARILLIRNLCANNEIPCVITKETKKEYCNYIEQNNPEQLADFLRNLSEKELQTMATLYDELNKKELILSNNMTKEQKLRYENNISFEEWQRHNEKEEKVLAKTLK